MFRSSLVITGEKSFSSFVVLQVANLLRDKLQLSFLVFVNQAMLATWCPWKWLESGPTISGLITFFFGGHLASSMWCLHVSPLGMWLLWVFLVGGMTGVDIVLDDFFFNTSSTILKAISSSLLQENEEMKGFVSSSFNFLFLPFAFHTMFLPSGFQNSVYYLNLLFLPALKNV